MLSGQELCKCLLSMCTMSTRIQEASESGELGESQVSLCAAPAAKQRGAGGVPVRGETYRGSSDAASRVPQLFGQDWAVAAHWDHCTYNTSFPSTAFSAAPQPAGQAQSRPLGAVPGDTWLCQLLTAFALSSPACMLCGQIDVDPSICGPKHVDFGICVHAFCAVSSPGAFSTFL